MIVHCRVLWQIDKLCGEDLVLMSGNWRAIRQKAKLASKATILQSAGVARYRFMRIMAFST